MLGNHIINYGKRVLKILTGSKNISIFLHITNASFLEVIMVKCSVCEEELIKPASLRPPLCFYCYYKQYKNEAECIRCGKLRKVNKRDENGSPICPTCSTKDNTGICESCDEGPKIVHNSKKFGMLLCDNCRRGPKSICKGCGELRRIVEETGICAFCTNRAKDKREVCSICEELKKVHKRVDGRPLCCKCSKIGYEYPKEVCVKCGKVKRVNKRDENGGAICGTCYELPKDICSICGELRPVYVRNADEVICDKCYEQPKKICSSCRNLRMVYKNVDGLPVCKYCVDKFRRANDATYKIVANLRGAVRRAFKVYSARGKKYRSKKYGIDYYKIAEYLMPAPENIEEYQIDHIFPLSAFDFNDPIQIRAAFAPENHQWLKIFDNLSKNNKYDKDKFDKYLLKFVEKG